LSPERGVFDRGHVDPVAIDDQGARQRIGVDGDAVRGVVVGGDRVTEVGVLSVESAGQRLHLVADLHG